MPLFLSNRKCTAQESVTIAPINWPPEFCIKQIDFYNCNNHNYSIDR
ncbi:hypothetical protein HMPREF1548_06421 [Clostridium sp. KLE 1755]|nr:hypothetical protein HMPREF1548_06421 [Clostridium sp. KLE 1755]